MAVFINVRGIVINDGSYVNGNLINFTACALAEQNKISLSQISRFG